MKIGIKVQIKTNAQTVSEALGAKGTVVSFFGSRNGFPFYVVELDDPVSLTSPTGEYATLNAQIMRGRDLIELPPERVQRPKPPKKGASQNERIIAFLADGNTLSPVEAQVLFGAYRLSARIYELKRRGYKITSRIKFDLNGKPYAEYRLSNRAAYGRR